jgi:hypothetical protein
MLIRLWSLGPAARGLQHRPCVKRRFTCRLAMLSLVAVLAATELNAQTLAANRPHRLLSDAALAASLEEARAHPPGREPAGDVPNPAIRLELPSILKSLTNTLKATPQMRATDMTVGLALIAATTRAPHRLSSVAVVGVEAIRLGLWTPNKSERTFDVHPDVSRHRFGLTVRKTF